MNNNPNQNNQPASNQNVGQPPVQQVPPVYKWYKDRATLIALITGFFSFVITMVNAIFG